MTNQSGQSYVHGVGKLVEVKVSLMLMMWVMQSAAGLTGGDITPIGASVGTKQGFSIIKFTTDSGLLVVTPYLTV